MTKQVLLPQRRVIETSGGIFPAPPKSTVRRKIQSRSKRGQRAFANNFSALNPTIWANEAIVQLLPNMVLANLIARDFDNKVARFGDIVNAYIPGTFQMTRKGALCENVVVQDASGASLQVPLDQWPQVSFLICDGEEDRAALDLVDTLLTPAIIALAQGIDRILGAQVYHFLENPAGHANNVDSTNIRHYVIEAREALNRRNVPVPGRALILTPGTESEALNVDAFTLAMDVGDQGQALRDATLGRKYGFDIFMTQTQAEVSGGQTTVGVVTAAAAAKGATTLALSGTGSANVRVGHWLVAAGDDVPHQITALVGAAAPYTATLNTPLLRATPGAAAVTIIASGSTSAAYAGTTMNPRFIGWAKEILVAGFPNSLPQIGQMVTFGNDLERYAIIQLRIIDPVVGTAGITLDRPLANGVANAASVNLGPAAKYNFGFLRNAFTLVNRPLPQPRAGTGAISRVIADPVNKIAIRVTITYDGSKQGHLVTLDTLMGVGVLSRDMGVVMLG